jgi:superfamily II DNA or RNA helicase
MLLSLVKPQTASGIHADETELVVLPGVWLSLHRIVKAAQMDATPSTCGYDSLFELSRVEHGKDPRKPFSGHMEPSTVRRYSGIWKQLLAFLLRSQAWASTRGPMPPYTLTVTQQNTLSCLCQAHLDIGHPLPEGDWRRVDQLLLDLLMALLDHEVPSTPYTNALVSGLAVLGVKETGGWVAVDDYTIYYSAFAKYARLFVLRQSVLEYEAQMLVSSQPPALFTLIRPRVSRFLTITSAQTMPSPMNFVLQTRRYGFHIIDSQPKLGHVQWYNDNQSIAYRSIRFSMAELRNMAQSLANKLNHLMANLLYIDLDREELPDLIPWDVIRDDPSEDTCGYSFLAHPDNAQWAERCKEYLVHRIFSNDTLRDQWLTRDTPARFRPSIVDRYSRLIDNFRDTLLVAMHLTGGQPARSPELLHLRVENTAYGGLRNLFIVHGMVSFVLWYHKSFLAQDRLKVINRYLPWAVGRELVRYLAIVRPFWHQVQGELVSSNRASSFLWTRVFIDPHVAITGDSCPSTSKSGTVITRDSCPSTSKSCAERMLVWPSERLRMALQTHSEELLGATLNVQIYRQLAAAISRQHLRSKGWSAERSPRVSEAMYDSDSDGEGAGEREDNIWDLQSGHTTHVADIHYGREVQTPQFGSLTREEQFRTISVMWHRFLGFGEPRRPGAVMEPFEQAWHVASAQRIMRLRQLDLVVQLRAMLQAPAAVFRGRQHEVLNTIVAGVSPILYVAATGEGKSLAFLLPAFCTPSGVTVVVSPLVSLQEDMLRRCRAMQIDATVWTTRGSMVARPLVFVTPESFRTKTFQHFLNSLVARCILDRIVIDECHLVLDAREDYRDSLLALGALVGGLAAQMVFLTATMPPLDEPAFRALMKLYDQPVRVIRSSTTRANLRYCVRTLTANEDCEAAAVAEVRRLLHRYPSRVVVFCRTIAQVERLARVLKCPRYYATLADKAEQLETWLGYKGSVIVATCALGMGIDVGNVRAVVHVAPPDLLREYCQESGRAGRDGSLAECVVLAKPVLKGKGATWMGTLKCHDLRRFLWDTPCRRLVLDEVMDGTERAGPCGAGEVACDLCSPADPVWYDPDMEPITYPDTEPITSSTSGLGRSSPATFNLPSKTSYDIGHTGTRGPGDKTGARGIGDKMGDTEDDVVWDAEVDDTAWDIEEEEAGFNNTDDTEVSDVSINNIDIEDSVSGARRPNLGIPSPQVPLSAIFATDSPTPSHHRSSSAFLTEQPSSSPLLVVPISPNPPIMAATNSPTPSCYQSSSAFLTEQPSSSPFLMAPISPNPPIVAAGEDNCLMDVTTTDITEDTGGEVVVYERPTSPILSRTPAPLAPQHGPLAKLQGLVAVQQALPSASPPHKTTNYTPPLPRAVYSVTKTPVQHSPVHALGTTPLHHSAAQHVLCSPSDRRPIAPSTGKTSTQPLATIPLPALALPASLHPGAADIAVQLERQHTVSRSSVRDSAAAGAAGIAAMRAYLDFFRDHCPVCFVLGQGACRHAEGACPEQDTWSAMRAEVLALQDRFFRSRGFQPYSACFFCGVPQDFCRRAWDKNITREARQRTECTYKNVIVHTVAAFSHVRHDEASRLYSAFGRAHRHPGTFGHGSYPAWLGFMYRYHGLQTSFLALLYHSVCKALQVYNEAAWTCDKEVTSTAGGLHSSTDRRPHVDETDPEAQSWVF